MSEKISKVKRDKPFTTMYNQALRDKDLSWQAKGLYAYLCSNSDDWSIKKSGLASMSTNGYDSTNTAFNELISKGYIVESGYDRKGGRFQGVNYEFHELPPNGENPDSVISPNGGFPETVKPCTVNPQLIKNNSITSNTNKEQINNNLNINTETSFSDSHPPDLFSDEVAKPKEEKPMTIRQKIIEFWLKEFHKGWTFSGTDGKKINSLIKKLENSLKGTSKKDSFTEEDVLNLFKSFCLKLPDFYKNETLSVLESKYDTIIEKIKESNAKQSNQAGQRSGVTNFRFDVPSV